MTSQRDEPIIIELDDPPPRGARFIGVAVGIMVFALLMAPFVLNQTSSPEESDIARTPRVASHNQFCQPTFDLPPVLSPVTSFTMPSWMRLCDWLSPPLQQPADRPPHT